MSTDAPWPRRRLTQAIVDDVDRLAPGLLSLSAVAAAVGISYRSLRRWARAGRIERDRIEKGQQPNPEAVLLLALVAALDSAFARVTTVCVSAILEAARHGEWRAACWLLERTNPDEWALDYKKELDALKRAFKELQDTEAENRPLNAPVPVLKPLQSHPLIAPPADRS